MFLSSLMPDNIKLYTLFNTLEPKVNEPVQQKMDSAILFTNVVIVRFLTYIWKGKNRFIEIYDIN
jgi:hypothetical protein